MDKQYESIVSFGCMCSVALHLNKLGLRSSSTFFDWLTSDIQSNMLLVDNDFRDVFNPTFFRQDYSEFPHLITHSEYHFIYTHIFDAKRKLSSQIRSVRAGVMRSIDNFRTSLLEKPTLLVYYCRDEKETNWIVSNQSLINDFAKRHTCDILFVFNYEVDDEFSFPHFFIPQNDIHKPIGGGVTYPFILTDALDEYLLKSYSSTKRNRNLKYKPKHRLLHKIIRKIASFGKDKLNVKSI